MSDIQSKHQEYREKLMSLSREDLLEILEAQNPELIKGINRIEWVFENKLGHLAWSDGEPIKDRPITKEELCLLVDVPFEFSQELASLGIKEQQQRELHVASDPVLWSKHYLNASPRVYQILIMRDPSDFRVLRAGRRLGKTWTMAVLLLWYSYITKNGKSLVVTPMKTQATLIYDECLKLAKDSNVVQESIIRSVQSPNPEIGLSNGSTIRFFTSGMKSGNKSDVTRGQEAHMIVLDELDYMGEDDMDALLAMLQKTDENQPDKKLIAASTPSGRKAKLWEWCHSKRFKDFWFPSYCNPFWSIEMEEAFHDTYTDIGYRHEIEADWGEDADGVYPRRYVDRSFVPEENSWDYELPHGRFNDPGSFTVFGVDWDKYSAGTNIVVLQVFNKDHEDPDWAGKIKLVYREETLREEYTLTKAVDRIIELNRFYNPQYIYVDRGYGEVQVELLKQYGTQNPYSGLATKLKGVSFSETVEVPDPHTGQKQKKDMKPFMVDTLRQYFERNMIFFTSADEELYRQLISYIVARITPTGRPVFEMAGNPADHCHDALILATLAIKQNYDDLMVFKSTNSVRTMSSSMVDPLLALASNGPQRSHEKEKAEDKYGSTGNAPVKIERANMVKRSSRKREIRRSRF
jgi:hypothetical protein